VSERATAELTPAGLREHPAAAAWRRLRPGAAEPTGVAPLRESEKSAVYRLEGAGPGGSAVVAKRCRAAAARIERTVYEEVLPRVPVTALRYYGHAEGDGDGTCWLFVENAGGARLSLDLDAHRVLAAHWLALLHTAAARVGAATRLPDRGPAHYLAHLRAARLAILHGRANPALCSDDQDVLEAIVRQCDALESRWHRVEEWCAATPATLVHGDFRPKNVHVRADGAGARLLAMDWETAGWGAPAADLASARGLPIELVDVATYCSDVRESWPGLDVRSIQRLVHVGRIFRRLAALDWDSPRLASRWLEKPMAGMRVYRAELAGAIEAAQWAR